MRAQLGLLTKQTKQRRMIRWITSQTRLLTLLFVCAMGVVGYLLAPADLAEGSYTAVFTLTVDDEPISAHFPFILGHEAGKPLVVTTANERYQLTVEGQDAIKYELGQKIAFRLQLTDLAGQQLPLSLEQATSTIYSNSQTNYVQKLPPTGQEDEGLAFTMHLPYKAKIATGLLFAVAALWLTELVPLAATALLIPVVLVITGVTDANTIFQPFAHPIIMLFLAGFLMAEGMKRTEVDRLLALLLLRRASLQPMYLMLTMMGLTAVLSMWMSNTASVAIVIPIALAVLDKIPQELGKTGFRRAMILGVAYAATVGGIGSAIGTPANILAMTFLNEFTGAELTFTDWFLYGLPMVIIMVPLIWLYLLLVFRVQLNNLGAHFSHDVYERELKGMGGLNNEQRTLLLLFTAVIGLWLSEQWHHIPTTIVALGGVFVLFYSGTVKQEDLNQINWNALLTFGGGLAIGTILVTTGVSDWIALQLTGLATLPTILVVLLISSFTLLVGAFISNTACAAMLIPMAIPLAQILQIDPRLLVAVIAIASSTDFALVVGTPPTMMAYSTGLFGAKDIFQRGIILDILSILVLTFGVIWIWQILGVVTLY